MEEQNQDQDSNPEGGGEEEGGEDLTKTHVALHDLRGCPFVCCRLVGIHVVTRNVEGGYEVSSLSIAQSMVMLVLSLVSMAIAVVKLYMPLPFWFSVVLFSVICGYAFCVYVFAHTCWSAPRMTRYMADFGTVPAWRFGWCKVIVSDVCYPLLVSFSTWFLLPEWATAFPSVFLTSAVPALLDAYIWWFCKGLTGKLLRLAWEVRRRDVWREEDVNALSLRWVAVTKLIEEHNKIFSLTLLLRLLLMLVQAMAYLFVLWATSTIIHFTHCLPVFAVTFLPLLEVMLRMFSLCLSGEELARAGEDVVVAVRWAAYTHTAASPQQLDLSALAARLEAHQTHLRIWGMDSLSISTSVAISRLVLTYLLALIQFCPSGKRDWSSGDQHGEFSRLNVCFPPPDPMNVTALLVLEDAPTPSLPHSLASLWRTRA